MLRDREELVRRLKAKPVHKAVRWYDPDVLVRVGIRDAISAVFGEYADQRLMQAATDGVGRDKLAGRYNYSAENSIPSHAGAYWVDYIADVGDGFGPTYGMAWLLAQKQLSLHNYHGESLPAGHILISRRRPMLSAGNPRRIRRAFCAALCQRAPAVRKRTRTQAVRLTRQP